ncbi:MAG: adenylate/guanylate cyclase domain-containing protein [Betaproteobacteria bacterium]
MHGQSGVITYFFTDIEGSARLWDTEPERMRTALARHDALTREAVAAHHGRVVKTTGDGFHAVFDDPLDAVNASVHLQLALADGVDGLPLKIRTGLHAGVDERRDDDFFGPEVNRAARIMGAAHGGQILLSEAVVALVSQRLPPDVALRAIGRVRLRDLANAEAVFQVIHDKLRQDFPALRSLEATPNNLPQQATSFVGRGHELAEVRRLLAKSRLLTLHGTGGLGKTRLSLQVAAEVIDDYPDGVWFVELAGLSDESRVPQAVATVLGVKEEHGRSVMESLLRFVSTRHLLLILDNCEHLVLSCAELAKRLLQSGAELRILASSREPLRIGGEVTYAVPPLSVPDPAKKLTQVSLAEYEAARLFISRVISVQPAFAVDDDNALAVAQICQRLDGIPLALELAAARARSLPVRAIAERLSDRFRLLSRGDQTAMPRQQTLRALIDWSHDLLSEPERILFRWLGVFAGGWTLEAAEAVCDSTPLDAGQVIDLLTLLVEKSLVAIDPLSGRYRFLDTIAQYARERLQDAGDNDLVRTRHLDHYLALAEHARSRLVGPEQARWLACLDDEFDNLLAALGTCVAFPGAGEAGLRLVTALRPYWIVRGELALGYARTLAAVEHAGAGARTFARCRALSDAGLLAYFMGRYPEASRLHAEGLSIAREIGDLGRIRALLHASGMAAVGEGDRVKARAHLDEALALAEASDNKHDLAAALNARASLHRLEGDLDTAETLYLRMVQLERELEDRDAMAAGLLNLAMVAIGRGQRAHARTLLREAIAIAEELGSRSAGQSVLEVCAGFAAIERDWSRAAFFYGAAETLAETTGLRRDPSDEAFLAPLIDSAKTALGEPRFAEGIASARSTEYGVALEAAAAWLIALPAN